LILGIDVDDQELRVYINPQDRGTIQVRTPDVDLKERLTFGFSP